MIFFLDRTMVNHSPSKNTIFQRFFPSIFGYFWRNQPNLYYLVTTHDKLGGGFKYFLFSSRTLGKISNLTSIFFRWVEKNHQPVNVLELVCTFSVRIIKETQVQVWTCRSFFEVLTTGGGRLENTTISLPGLRFQTETP